MSYVAFYVSAHADDWIFFRGHQAWGDLRETGDDVRVVFVYTSAGDAGRDNGWWQARESGDREAQGYAVGLGFSDVHSLDVNGHHINGYIQKRDAGAPIKVVSYHMRLPDGDVSGTGFPYFGHQSLRQLRTNNKPITAVDRSAQYSSWSDFCKTLEGILSHEAAAANQANPWVNAGDWSESQNPQDHSDHRETAYALRDIFASSGNRYNRAWWVGYDIANRSGNLDPISLSRKEALWRAYASKTETNYTEWNAFGSKAYWRTVFAGIDDSGA